MFCFIGVEAPGILGPDQKSNPRPPALEGKVFTTGRQDSAWVLMLSLLINSYLSISVSRGPSPFSVGPEAGREADLCESRPLPAGAGGSAVTPGR